MIVSKNPNNINILSHKSHVCEPPSVALFVLAIKQIILI